MTGELFEGGVGVARGYPNLPGHTAEAFVPDAHGPAGARLYRTGDLVRRALDGLFARHESLRTRFAADRGEPVHVVDPPRGAEPRALAARMSEEVLIAKTSSGA